MLRAYNQDPANPIRFGRVALTTLALWPLMAQASGGAALNVTALNDGPTVWKDGSEQSDVAMRLYFVPSGTWAAVNIVVKSPLGDETLAVPAMSTTPVRTNGYFRKSDITKIITSGDPGAMAKLDGYWSYDAGAKPCQAGATAGDIAGICTKRNDIGSRTWGSIGQLGESLAIEKDASAAASIAIGTELYLLAAGTVRELKGTDAAGVVPGAVKGAPITVPSIAGKVFIPVTFNPRDL